MSASASGVVGAESGAGHRTPGSGRGRWPLVAATVAVLGGIALAQSAWAWWPGELASHWTLHGAVAAVILAGCWRRRPRVAGLCLLAVLAGLWPWLLAWQAPRAPEAGAGAALTVVHANLYYLADRHGDALRQIAATGATLVCLVEAAPSDRARAELAPWPHRVWSEHPSSLIGLLSAHPIQWSLVHGPDKVVEAVVQAPGGAVRVLAAHPSSPFTPRRAAGRDRQLAVLARLAAASREPVLVLGDLNCTVASPTWRSFQALSGLRRPAAPAGATWPSQLGPLGIRIDHLLVGDGLALADERIIALPGSDHRGLAASLRFVPARP